MLDLKFLRENPDIVKQNIKNKFQDSKLPLVDEVIALDIENRKSFERKETTDYLLQRQDEIVEYLKNNGVQLDQPWVHFEYKNFRK